MSGGIPELLVKSDFSSPLLYKIYKYLRIIHRNGIVYQPMRRFFTENELITIITTLKNCPYDTEFIDKFKDGIYEDKNSRSTHNLGNFLERTFVSSFIQKKINHMAKKFYPNKPTDGEIEVLECLFYNYANKVFQPKNDDELGYDGDVVYASFKRKELQLESINRLFSNIGNRITEKRNQAINEALTKSLYSTDINGNKIYENVEQLITSFL